MKLETFKEDLRLAIAGAERVTGKNLSLPTLGYVMLEAKERSLLVRATNLDLGVEISLPAKVAEPGQLTVSGAVLGNFLANLNKDEKIVLETRQNTLAIVTTHTKSAFNTYPSDDFPSLPKAPAAAGVKLPTSYLTAGLKAVSYAASNSDIKPEIASVYLYQDGGDLVFVATDSFRLAEKRIVLDKKVSEPLALIIPIKNALEILRLFEGVGGEAVLSATPDQLFISAGNIFFTSRLVAGVFPDYRQIMPTNAATEAVVLKNDLFNTLKLANIFTDKLNQILFKVSPQSGQLELSSRSSEIGEVASSLEATLEGEVVEANYNARFVLDCFSSLTTDSISLSFNGRSRPVALRGIGDQSFTYLVMPLNR
jgi:DNA polymerase-3 subunit beta